MELLRARMQEGKFLCIGLDSDVTKIPRKVRGGQNIAQLSFNTDVVDATHHLAQAYKPNIAFYPDDDEGRYVLAETIAYIKQVAPNVPIILDAKRGDIGNTNAGYVKEVAYFGADAVTVNPYMGFDEAIDVFTADPTKGVIILCRTSNQGAGMFQDREVVLRIEEIESGGVSTRWLEGRDVGPLYRVVAHSVTNCWNDNGNCAVVVGATNPKELASVRRIVGDMPILVPGFGAQGGKTEATFKAGLDSTGSGLICNVARGLIFPEDRDVAAAGASWDAEFRRCQALALANTQL